MQETEHGTKWPHFCPDTVIPETLSSSLCKRKVKIWTFLISSSVVKSFKIMVFFCDIFSHIWLEFFHLNWPPRTTIGSGARCTQRGQEGQTLIFSC